MIQTEKLPVFRKQLIIKGALWFALLTIGGIAAVFFYNNTGQTVDAISYIKPGYIFICLCMLFVDLLLGGCIVLPHGACGDHAGVHFTAADFPVVLSCCGWRFCGDRAFKEGCLNH